MSGVRSSRIRSLKCRECGREYELEPLHVCDFCFGPLEVTYNYEEITRSLTKEKIRNGPKSLWRYKELLPIETEDPLDLGTGFTPLIRSTNLAKELGLKELYLKNDTVNPTFSFKDRVVSVALTKTREFGYTTVACASTGNLGNSVAAHAAKAGFESYIFIPADLERGKILTSAIYGPNLIGVEGSYDDVNRLCSEIANEYDWAFVNINIRPYYAEGSKTLAFETAEQLGWVAPDHVVIPVASGSLLTKIHKGFEELHQIRFIPDSKTRISGAQATGCAPVATAFANHTFTIRPVKPNTIAKSIAIGNPADGYYALKAVTETGGFVESVTDEELVEGIKLLARTEGIFSETAGGVTIGVLKKLVESGKIASDEVIVAYITGIGLKTVEAVENALEGLQVIKPSVADFNDKILRRNPSLGQ